MDKYLKPPLLSPHLEFLDESRQLNRSQTLSGTLSVNDVLFPGNAFWGFFENTGRNVALLLRVDVAPCGHCCIALCVALTFCVASISPGSIAAALTWSGARWGEQFPRKEVRIP